MCFIHVFDQTVAEQLYRDKGLLSIPSVNISFISHLAQFLYNKNDKGSQPSQITN